MAILHLLTAAWCISVSNSANRNGRKAPNSLRFVHAVWRHGDRSPMGTVPNDRENGEETWEQGWAELTPIGIKQLHDLGVFLRNRYDGFLSSSYQGKEIYIRSTDENRTIMSAQAALSGLYPPSGSQLWNKTILWQPIPVHVVPIPDDQMLRMAGCPRTNVLEEEFRKGKIVKQFNTQNQELINYLQEKSGIPWEDLYDDSGIFGSLFDPMNCEMHHNDSHSWPAWMNQTLFNQIVKKFYYTTTFLYQKDEMKRLRAGILLEDIVNRLKAKQEHNSNKLDPRLKFIGYSAHDSTLIGLLSILGAYNNIHPPYASTVLIELHERYKKWEIEVWYKNESFNDVVHNLQISGCKGKKCALTGFISRSLPLIPKDWKKECQFPTDQGLSTHGYMLFMVCLTILCLSLGLGVHSLLKDYIRIKRGSGRIVYSPVNSW